MADISINKPEIKRIIKSFENGNLSTHEISALKKEYNPNQIELILACLNNEKDKLEMLINDGVDLSICNDYILRYTVTKGWIEISRLLLKYDVEP